LLTTCPECSGKLSSVAPSCPHCGFVQNLPPVPAAPAKLPDPPPPPLILPSDASVRKADRARWSEWIDSSLWRPLFGAVILLVALGLLVLVFLIALRLNDDRDKQGRRDSTGTPVLK
jgi:hypothetical protein